MDLKNKISKFPSEPGIYLFFNKKGELVYVGKATNLRARVRSYFRNPPQPSLKKGGGLRPIEAMIDEVVNIKVKVTDSVLEAIILEANYIKKFRPKYNVDLKDDKSWNYIVITKDGYLKVKTVRAHELSNVLNVESVEDVVDEKQLQQLEQLQQFQHIFGPYPGLNTKATMRLLQRLFYISSCKPLVKFKKQGDPSAATSLRSVSAQDGRPCLYYQMGQCLGVCTGEITPADYKKKVISPLVKFLRGNKKGLIRDLVKKMKLESKEQNFEEAGRLRNQIKALERIHDIALLNKTFINEQLSTNKDRSSLVVDRIEGYDISNLGDTGKVGSMVVFENNYSNKSQYRKFKIKNVVGQSDVDCLAEMLERRLKHPEWKMPDVFMVDGGKPQVNITKKILKEQGIKTPVVGIAKGPDRKKNEIILGARNREFVEWVYKNTKLLIQVRDEAHRFAITYQKSLRKIKH